LANFINTLLILVTLVHAVHISSNTIDTAYWGLFVFSMPIWLWLSLNCLAFDIYAIPSLATIQRQQSTISILSASDNVLCKQQCYRSGSVGSVCFLPPGSGSVSHSYGSGSRSDPSIIKKNSKKNPLIPTVLLRLYDFLSLKKYVNITSERNKQKP
jgi:hypothetical protein